MKKDEDILNALDSLLETLQEKFNEKATLSTKEDSEEAISARQVKELLNISEDEMSIAFACGAYNVIRSILKADLENDFLTKKSVVILSGVSNNAVDEINSLYKKIKLKKEKN